LVHKAPTATVITSDPSPQAVRSFAGELLYKGCQPELIKRVRGVGIVSWKQAFDSGAWLCGKKKLPTIISKAVNLACTGWYRYYGKFREEVGP
jgi:hypothetical protein